MLVMVDPYTSSQTSLESKLYLPANRVRGYMHSARCPEERSTDTGVAHKCFGMVQKNAAIALARLAQDPACLQRLRELHGIEIMYRYVKP